MKLRFRSVFSVVLAVSLALGGRAVAADGFWILADDLPLAGQTNWVYYNGGDGPEGSYMGWLHSGATSLRGNIDLKRTLPAGTYYVMVKVIDYMGNGQVRIAAGSGLSTTNLNDRD